MFCIVNVCTIGALYLCLVHYIYASCLTTFYFCMKFESNKIITIINILYIYSFMGNRLNHMIKIIMFTKILNTGKNLQLDTGVKALYVQSR